MNSSKMDVLAAFNLRKSTLSEYLNCELWRASSMIFKVGKTLIFKINNAENTVLYV